MLENSAIWHLTNASEQHINLKKTELLISINVGEEEVNSIKALWNVQSIQYHTQYMGLPSFVGHARSSTFQNLKSRVLNKLQRWKEKILSQAG